MNDPSASNGLRDAGRSEAGRWWVAVAATMAFAAGAVIGGYLDYGAWHANAALLSAAPVTLAFVVATASGVWWFASRRRFAGIVAVVTAAYVLGSLVGSWVAPDAHRPQWSPGTIGLTLDDPALGTVGGTADCETEADGSFSVSIGSAQMLAGTPIGYSLRGPGPGGDRGSIGFDLFVAGGDGGPMWTTNEESTRRDILDVVLVDGSAAAGEARFVEIVRSPDDVPDDTAFGGPPPATLSGTVTWTCEPPRGEPTPIEGTWFG